jgi:hypothetical protein
VNSVLCVVLYVVASVGIPSIVGVFHVSIPSIFVIVHRVSGMVLIVIVLVCSFLSYMVLGVTVTSIVGSALVYIILNIFLEYGCVLMIVLWHIMSMYCSYPPVLKLFIVCIVLFVVSNVVYILYRFARFVLFIGVLLYLHVASMFVLTVRLNGLVFVVRVFGLMYIVLLFVIGVMFNELFRFMYTLMNLYPYPIFPAWSNAFTHNNPLFVNVSRLLYDSLLLYVSCVQSVLFV